MEVEEGVRPQVILRITIVRDELKVLSSAAQSALNFTDLMVKFRKFPKHAVHSKFG